MSSTLRSIRHALQSLSIRSRSGVRAQVRDCTKLAIQDGGDSKRIMPDRRHYVPSALSSVVGTSPLKGSETAVPPESPAIAKTPWHIGLSAFDQVWQSGRSDAEWRKICEDKKPKGDTALARHDSAVCSLQTFNERLIERLDEVADLLRSSASSRATFDTSRQNAYGNLNDHCLLYRARHSLLQGRDDSREIDQPSSYAAPSAGSSFATADSPQLAALLLDLYRSELGMSGGGGPQTTVSTVPETMRFILSQDLDRMAESAKVKSDLLDRIDRAVAIGSRYQPPGGRLASAHETDEDLASYHLVPVSQVGRATTEEREKCIKQTLACREKAQNLAAATEKIWADARWEESPDSVVDVMSEMQTHQ